MEAKIREILKGIDKDQCESMDGWWETSTGAEFGKGKLNEILKLLTQPNNTEGRELIRQAVADYMYSEGCSCCQDIDEHTRMKKVLAELLDVEPYDDGSGYNFYHYSTLKD